MIHIKKCEYFPLGNLTASILTSNFIRIRKKFNCRESNRAVYVMQMRRHNPVLINKFFNTFVKIHDA